MGMFERADKDAPKVDATADDTDAPDELGPAFTSEFPQAVGLDAMLAGGSKASSSGTAAPGGSAQGAPVSIPPLDPKVVQQYLAQLDLIISSLSDLEPEDTDIMAGISQGVYPLVNHYASGQSSVAVMWFVASTSILAYIGLKYKQLQLRAADYSGGGGEAQTVDRRPDNGEEG